jgi:hypothetical protein
MFSSISGSSIGEGIYSLLGAFNVRNKRDYMTLGSLSSTVAQALTPATSTLEELFNAVQYVSASNRFEFGLANG